MPTITFTLDEETYTAEIKPGTDIAGALEKAGINPLMVLVKEKSKVVPHREKLSADASFELIKVISGG